MRKFLPLLVVFAICSFSFSFPDNSDAIVKQIAEVNLKTSLEKIPVGQELNFGFANRAEFNSAQVGNPYRMITFTNEFYQDTKLTDKNYFLVQPEWRVPVSVYGVNRVLLTVFKQDSSLSVVDIGGAVLSKELQEKTPATVAGFNYLLRIYPLTMDLIVSTKPNQSLEEGLYIPLQSAKSAIKVLNEKPTFTFEEILKLVKEKLAEQSKN